MELVFKILALLIIALFILINLKVYFHSRLLKENKEIKEPILLLFFMPFLNPVNWFKMVLPIYPSDNFSKHKGYKTIKKIVNTFWIILFAIVLLFVFLESNYN